MSRPTGEPVYAYVVRDQAENVVDVLFARALQGALAQLARACGHRDADAMVEAGEGDAFTVERVAQHEGVEARLLHRAGAV